MSTKQRILHIAPANTSGVPGQFVQTERQLGFNSRLVTLFRDPRNYFQDICLNLPFIDFAPTKLIKKLVSNPQKLKIVNKAPKPETIPIVWRPHSLAEKTLVALRDWWWQPRVRNAIKKYKLDEFDVYQLDGGLGLFRNASFIQEMKERGKKIICCYTGSDLRTRGVIEKIDQMSERNFTVEFDHTLLHPNILHVFFPFDATRFKPHEHHDNSTSVIIGHAPTNRAAKGSDIIIPVLQKLSIEYNVKIELIEGLSYQEALNRKQECDLFVDQIGDLGYGINSLEAMAMGIPACSCLAPGFAEMYPDHAFIDINAENLTARLIPLIQDAELRRAVGERGRLWVCENHDARKVVQKIHDIAGIK